MLILGHRGASAHELENTIPAFRRAVADGADGVELDVLRSRDGEVVVFHDEDLKRLAGRRERVERVKLAELRALPLRNDRGLTGRIPTLSEVFEELGPGFLVNVELKADRPLGAVRLVPAVCKLLRRHGRSDSVIVSSFNPLALAQFRAELPKVRTGILFHRKMRRPLREAWARRALHPSAVHPEHELVNEPNVRRWRREGFAIHVWTVDDRAELRRLRGLGVDAVISNDPGAARR